MWPLWSAWPRGCNAHRERNKTSRAGVETFLAHHLRSIFTLLPGGLGGRLGSLGTYNLRCQGILGQGIVGSGVVCVEV